MAEQRDVERHLLARLVAIWLEARTGQAVTQVTGADSGLWALDLPGVRVRCAIESVSTAAAAPGWQDRLDALAARLTPLREGGALIWLPAGADLPDSEPAQTEQVQTLNRAIADLAPDTLADAALPIEIHIRKRDDTGAYVSAYGALAAHWARFTERVQGYFQIDSTALHRLPAGEPTVVALVDKLIETSRSLELDASLSIDAADYWRVQRLSAVPGIAIVATPPDDESETGAALRKRLRTVLREAGSALRSTSADLRLLALYAHYPSIDDEPVGAALRGQDPSLFGSFDLVLLVADGQVRPLIDITRKPVLSPSPRSS